METVKQFQVVGSLSTCLTSYVALLRLFPVLPLYPLICTCSPYLHYTVSVGLNNHYALWEYSISSCQSPKHNVLVTATYPGHCKCRYM